MAKPTTGAAAAAAAATSAAAADKPADASPAPLPPSSQEPTPGDFEDEVPPDEDLAAQGKVTHAEVSAEIARRQRTRARAFVSDYPDRILFRPDPVNPLQPTDLIVHGNWVGRFKGKTCRVSNATPAADIPEELGRMLLRDGLRVGPVKPPESAA